MKLRNAGTDDLSELCDLWLRAAPAQGYAPLQEEQMRALIFENPHFDGRLSFMLEENGAHGFACAAFVSTLVRSAAPCNVVAVLPRRVSYLVMGM